MISKAYVHVDRRKGMGFSFRIWDSKRDAIELNLAEAEKLVSVLREAIEFYKVASPTKDFVFGSDGELA